MLSQFRKSSLWHEVSLDTIKMLQTAFFSNDFRENPFPCFFEVLAEFTSSWLLRLSSHFLTGSCQKAFLRFQKLPAFLTPWHLFISQASSHQLSSALSLFQTPSSYSVTLFGPWLQRAHVIRFLFSRLLYSQFICSVLFFQEVYLQSLILGYNQRLILLLSKDSRHLFFLFLYNYVHGAKKIS